MTEEARRALWAALEEERKRPPGELFKEMVADGVIDENGKVLLPSRSPWNPAWGPEPDWDDESPQS
jgi:hypothetical protein